MNIFPKNVFRGQSSSGEKFRVEEYDYSTHVNLQFIDGILIVIAGVILCYIIQIPMMLFTIIHFRGQKWYKFIPALLTSVYLLVDAHFGWVVTLIASILFSNNTLNTIVCLNWAFIFVYITLIVFSQSLFSFILKVTDNLIARWVLFLAVIGVVMFIGYSRGTQILSNNPLPVVIQYPNNP